MAYVVDVTNEESFEKLKQILEELAQEPWEGEWVDTSCEVDDDLEELDFNQE
jgi:hypothetical protein